MLDLNSNSRLSAETLSFVTSDSSGALGSLLLFFPHVTIVRLLTLTTRKDAMGGQRTLFMQMQQGLPDGEPRGFRYREQIIGEDEEVALAAELEKLALKPFEFHGYFGNRRVVNFGLKYDFSRRSVEKQMICPRFSTFSLAGLHTSRDVRRTPFDKWELMSIVPVRESDGTRTNHNLESSLACRS